jgi:hypothetical protein
MLFPLSKPAFAAPEGGVYPPEKHDARHLTLPSITPSGSITHQEL